LNENTALLSSSRSLDVESEYLSEAEYLEAEAEKQQQRDELRKDRRRQLYLVSGLSILVVALLFVVSTQYGDWSDRITHGQFFQQIASAVTSVTGGGVNSKIVSQQSATTVSNSAQPMSGSISEDTFMFTMAREGYSELPYFSSSSANAMFNYKFLADYDGIVEPSSANTLALLDDDSSSDTSVYFLYTVCPTGVTGGSECYTGSYSLSGSGPGTVTITPSCSPYDALDISVTAYSIDSGEELFTSEGKLLCLYVRREIRDLSDDDLTKTMDAMYEMWVTTDEDGQEKYGDNYKSAKYLLEYHFFNAAWQDAGEFYVPSFLLCTPLFFVLPTAFLICISTRLTFFLYRHPLLPSDRSHS